MYVSASSDPYICIPCTTYVDSEEVAWLIRSPRSALPKSSPLDCMPTSFYESNCRVSARDGIIACSVGQFIIHCRCLPVQVHDVTHSRSLFLCMTGHYNFLPERDYVTFGSLLAQFRLSVVCRLSVCNVGAPFRQNFFTAVYAGHPLTSMQNFTEIVLGELPLRRER